MGAASFLNTNVMAEDVDEQSEQNETVEEGSSNKTISKELEEIIMTRCSVIKENLHEVQRDDARTRVYLGKYYEAVITRFVTPLNVRLVENNLSSTSFIDNQNDLTKTRTSFTIDFIEYQKTLEELVAMNCEKEPGGFYAKIEEARRQREAVLSDTKRMMKLINDHKDLVVKLEGRF